MRFAEVDGPPAGRFAGDRQALVEHHRPARRQVVDGQSRRIQIGVLFHGFGELDAVGAVLGRQSVRVQEVALHRARLGVDPGRGEIAERRAAEHVADEAVALAVPGEEHRAAGQLALCFDDGVAFPGRQRQLGLGHAVRPGQFHEIRLVVAAQANAEGLNALARSGVRVQNVQHGPATAGANLHHRADPGGVGTHLRCLVAPAQGQRKEPVPAGAGRPKGHAVGRCRQHPWPTAGVEGCRHGAHHPVHRVFGEDAPRARIDHREAIAAHAQEVRPAVAVEIRNVQLDVAVAAALGDVFALPAGAIAPPAEDRPIRPGAVDLAPPVRIRIGCRNCDKRRVPQVVEAGEGLVLPKAVVLPDVVRRRLVDGHDVQVAVAVEVDDQRLPPIAAAQAHLFGQLAVAAVAVVAVEGIALGADGEHVQVAVVVGVEDRAAAARKRAQLRRRRPAAALLLAHQPRAGLGAKHRVDAAVVVHVAHQQGAGRRCVSQRVIRPERGSRGRDATVGDVAEDERRVVGHGDEVGRAVAVDVGQRKSACMTSAVHGSRHGDRRAEQRPRWQRVGRRRGWRRRQGARFRPHPRIGESGQQRGRVVLEALVVGEQRRRVVVAPQAPQRLRSRPIGAAQIGRELGALQQPLGGAGVVALLQQRLAEKVGRVGVLGVGEDGLPELRRGLLGVAEVKMQDGAGVEGAQMHGVFGEHLRQDVQGKLLVALLLAVQGGDGEVRAGVQPVRRLFDDGGEHLLGSGVLVAPHERHAAVVLGDQIRRNRLVAGAAEKRERDGERRRAPVCPSDAGEPPPRFRQHRNVHPRCFPTALRSHANDGNCCRVCPFCVETVDRTVPSA